MRDGTAEGAISEIDVAVEVGGHFDALGVVWLVGGSVDTLDPYRPSVV